MPDITPGCTTGEARRGQCLQAMTENAGEIIEDFHIVPVHKVFAHRAMMANGGLPAVPARNCPHPHPPHQTSPETDSVVCFVFKERKSQ